MGIKTPWAIETPGRKYAYEQAINILTTNISLLDYMTKWSSFYLSPELKTLLIMYPLHIDATKNTVVIITF